MFVELCSSAVTEPGPPGSCQNVNFQAGACTIPTYRAHHQSPGTQTAALHFQLPSIAPSRNGRSQRRHHFDEQALLHPLFQVARKLRDPGSCRPTLAEPRSWPHTCKCKDNALSKMRNRPVLAHYSDAFGLSGRVRLSSGRSRPLFIDYFDT